MYSLVSAIRASLLYFMTSQLLRHSFSYPLHVGKSVFLFIRVHPSM